MRAALTDIAGAGAGAGLILAGLTGCQNSTSVLEPAVGPPPASKITGKASNSDSKAVAVRDGISEAIRMCTSQGPKFERSTSALQKAGYSLGAAKPQAKGATVREATSSDGKYIVKLGTAANGFKSCQILFRSTNRTQRSIAQAVAADGRLIPNSTRGAANPYRFKATGHPAAIVGPLTSTTSRDVGVLFTISQVKKS